MNFTPSPSFIFQRGKNQIDEWELKIFFELKPRCALLLSVVGAYNKGCYTQFLDYL